MWISRDTSSGVRGGASRCGTSSLLGRTVAKATAVRRKAMHAACQTRFGGRDFNWKERKPRFHREMTWFAAPGARCGSAQPRSWRLGRIAPPLVARDHRLERFAPPLAVCSARRTNGPRRTIHSMTVAAAILRPARMPARAAVGDPRPGRPPRARRAGRGGRCSSGLRRPLASITQIAKPLLQLYEKRSSGVAGGPT